MVVNIIKTESANRISFGFAFCFVALCFFCFFSWCQVTFIPLCNAGFCILKGVSKVLLIQVDAIDTGFYR